MPLVDHRSRPPAASARKLLVLVLSATVVLAGCERGEDPAVGGNSAAEQDHNAADVAFAKGMIPHHQQAIEMSDLVPAQAQRSEVKDLARRIKAAQQPEIDQMRRWLTSWGEREDAGGHGDGHGGHDVAGMLSDEQMQQLKQARGAEFDRQFLTGMIEHHEGAVTMARTELAEGKFAEAKDLARRIIESQQAEIAEMRSLLQR